MMMKVSFKKDYKKVQTFNNKVTEVSLIGKIKYDKHLDECLSRLLSGSIYDWMTRHPSIEVTESYGISTFFMLKSVGKSKVADGDTFDAKMGERIAECRAKIKIYRFMQTLTKMLCKYYYSMLYGKQEKTMYPIHHDDSSLCADYKRYTDLLQHERYHLNELLQKTT